ncbi:unnamed protein product [Cyclocybe aegerita]|uniref:Beta-mannosidase B n=1 Tax=Cyclocybe aegerita TaxID=1973307 RepID=A0A8S0XUI3_CYCAE|nr:unnamed protein product [Cyclocybe aegerita]
MASHTTSKVFQRDLGDHNIWFWKQRSSDVADVLEELEPHGNGETGSFVSEWKKSSVFPSEVHVELLTIGAIPHPYVGFNEHKVQWIGEVEWLYKCSFSCDASGRHRNAILTFEGLDTICDVYLNRKKVLSANNQFRTYTYQIPASPAGPGLDLQSENILLLHFKSAKALAKVEEEKYGKVRAGSTNLGDPSRVYIRKAQYDWRWDWGPELMTCGPYRPIKLTTYDVRIENFHPWSFISFKPGDSSLDTIVLNVDITLTGSVDLTQTSVLVTLLDADRRPIRSQSIQLKWGEQKATTAVSWADLQLDGVELWWPVGYGKQTLYTVNVSLLDAESNVVDKKTKRIGFRTVELVQEPLAEPDQYGTGTTFLFEINKVRMFMGGSNWIPADNLLTTITEERYRSWLTLLRDGNQNMVRLWGGGIYEPDIFYDICDELGLLVWQDFQFACGVYPAHDDFVASVKQEAEDNVTRLRHHPCIAVFCGNNEDYQQVLQWGGIGELPARLIYEHVLPDVVSRLTDPPLPYHRGSPYGGKGWDTSDPTIGDVHQWNVWGGKELQYQEYDRLGGRFVSEFGIPSMPPISTIKYWMQGVDASQWYSQSPLMAQHTKAGSFERRFAIVMNENFRLTSDFETHVYITQLMQSEAVSFAYRVWRREWRGRGHEYNAGVLVWQSNDCWPVVSWSLADYFLRPKPVYYTIARQLAPISVGIFRIVVKNRDNDRPRQFYEFGATQTFHATLEIWGANSTLSARPARLELRFFDLLSSDWSYSEDHEVTLLPNQSTELVTLRCPGPVREEYTLGDPLYVGSANVVASARLVDPTTGEVLARFSDWPEPYRFLQPPDPGLNVEVHPSQGNGRTELRITVDRPAKCVVFSAAEEPGRNVKWSDNALDLVPGDAQVIIAEGLKGAKISVAYFGHEKSSYL